jgi:hypothetical protein
MGAQVYRVSAASRESLLRGFADSFGKYPPRQPIPDWWEGFEEFYRKLKEDEVDYIGLRVESFPYEDDEETEDGIWDDGEDDYDYDPEEDDVD